MRSKVDGALVWGEERYFFFLENVAGSKGNFVYLQSNRAYTALKISTIVDHQKSIGQCPNAYTALKISTIVDFTNWNLFVYAYTALKISTIVDGNQLEPFRQRRLYGS